MSMLEVDNIQVFYGAIHALKGISFHLDQGEIVALIGGNGAGKSTSRMRRSRAVRAAALPRVADVGEGGVDWCCGVIMGVQAAAAAGIWTMLLAGCGGRTANHAWPSASVARAR